MILRCIICYTELKKVHAPFRWVSPDGQEIVINAYGQFCGKCNYLCVERKEGKRIQAVIDELKD